MGEKNLIAYSDYQGEEPKEVQNKDLSPVRAFNKKAVTKEREKLPWCTSTMLLSLTGLFGSLMASTTCCYHVFAYNQRTFY